MFKLLWSCFKRDHSDAETLPTRYSIFKPSWPSCREKCRKKNGKQMATTSNSALFPIILNPPETKVLARIYPNKWDHTVGVFNITEVGLCKTCF